VTDRDALSEPADAYVAAPTSVDKGRAGPAATEWLVMRAYDAHERGLYAFARSLVRDPDAAEDLVADTFLRLVHETAAGRTPDQVRPWLFRVLANQAINQARRRSVAARMLARIVSRDTVEPPDAGLLRTESGVAVREALLTLPMPMRTALRLAAEGVPGREIAAAIGRSEAATRTLLSRGRVRLREQLERGGGVP
jgi:RNA polymerase sigma-70 factor (ECF subfamily)